MADDKTNKLYWVCEIEKIFRNQMSINVMNLILSLKSKVKKYSLEQ